MSVPSLPSLPSLPSVPSVAQLRQIVLHSDMTGGDCKQFSIITNIENIALGNFSDNLSVFYK